jgi:hypothetical protein
MRDDEAMTLLPTFYEIINLQILEIFIKIFHFVFCYKDFGYSSLISVPSVAKIRLSILMCREDEKRRQ